MSHFKKNLTNYRIFLLILIVLNLTSCKVIKVQKSLTSQDIQGQTIIEEFKATTGIDAIWISDTALLNKVKSWQGVGDYPGVDKWATATIPVGSDLYGGLPGQSEYYTISQTLVSADTMKVAYWESLQVKAHPTYGYRPSVGVFDLSQKTTVAIARTLANSQYGKGGAWQIYLENFTTVLSPLDTIALKN